MFVKLENINFKYANNEDLILNDLSFELPKGCMLAILGPNGSGKSTIAKLIMGLLKPTSGHIYIGDEELTEKSVNHLRKKLSIIFQNPDNQFVGVTVKDDIAFGLENLKVERSKMQEAVNQYAQMVDMSEYLDANPENLSGGQKQRVAIAGALAMQTDLIIFDEATSMLDPKGTKEIIEMIKTLKNSHQKTIITITHNLEEALFADKVMVLNQGKIVLEGTPREVLKEKTILEASGLKLIDGLFLIDRINNSALEESQKKVLTDKLWELTFKM